MKFAVNYARLVFALLNQQPPEKLFAAAVGVPLTGFVGLGLVWVLSHVLSLLAVLLVAYGLLLLSMAVVKVAQQFFWRFTR
ncbi:hypothetical protein [Phormidium sp. FACHB-1136]|uniref:hypothetical protein n=1 Tax=Phormidium sp. FACHB-1136 TaxID=2692848 RepID=UPI001682E65D|nr:hypothetical protein [Phormidium sp. FACHB-1136]MBD2428418.1 hypothetical protein [Phormidium sp. FACHB-1136]